MTNQSLRATNRCLARHRQFLFRQKDVGRPKATVAAEAIMARVPGCNVKAHHAKIQDFDADFYSQVRGVTTGAAVAATLTASRGASCASLACRSMLLVAQTHRTKEGLMSRADRAVRQQHILHASIGSLVSSLICQEATCTPLRLSAGEPLPLGSSMQSVSAVINFMQLAQEFVPALAIDDK